MSHDEHERRGKELIPTTVVKKMVTNLHIFLEARTAKSSIVAFVSHPAGRWNN